MPSFLQRCVRSTIKVRILWTPKTVREAVEVDILSARAVTLSTSQVDCSIFIFAIILTFYSRWTSLRWGAVQVPLQLANFMGDSFIATLV